MNQKSISKLRGIIFFSTLSLGLLCTNVANAEKSASLFIRDVTIIPMTGAKKKVPHVTVEIANGKIISIQKFSTKHKCKDNCIDGRGKWLIPGLTDAHVHLENDRMLQLYMNLPAKPEGAVTTADMVLPFIANGVTQVFNLSAMSESFEQQKEIKSGKTVGPRIINAFMIDGEKPILPEGMSHSVSNPEEGRDAVKKAFNDGYDIIKIYSLVDFETFRAIIDEANKHNMRVLGHIPGRNQNETGKYFMPGFGAVAHAEEFAMQTQNPDESKIPEYVEMSKRNNTALISTLTLDDNILAETSDPSSLKSRKDLSYLNPMLQMIVQEHNPYVAQASPERTGWLQSIVKFNQVLVKEFSKAGIPILAGTDSPVPGVAPGFSLPDELEALNKAGLTPYQALYSATKAPCDWLGNKAKCGSIAKGHNADLVLLDSDPTAKISNIRKISAVILNGKVIYKSELDEKLTVLKQKIDLALGK